ncbi:phosphomannomutase/phosphoglucomutase [Treponema ruminis]|uniref:Phosphomannomutase n=1 Tax=Treponema ruminis TaxID=744515 RepID=A0A7W8G6K5_9SPIR|nr:phosphomannomutase/phosphoglucomutase [Treponema ruminis]MBB5224684.1 phosphomannomutase [Treponema ruminis]
MESKELLKLQNGSDIRGVACEGIAGESVNLTPLASNIIAQSFAAWLSKKCGKPVQSLTVGIGRDSRITGEALSNAAIAGLSSCGVKVVDCGMATTPAMFMSIVFPETKFDGSIMITASHLPFNRNGLKFFDKDGGLEHEDITAILEGAVGLSEKSGKVSAQKFDLISLYANHLVKTIKEGVNSGDKPLEGLKIVVDAGNGAGGFFVSKILDQLGAETKGSQFLEPDGTFPNHIPNPENAKAMEAIQSAVLKNKADLGLIFDTDVDRMSAVLPDGTEVNRDAIIALVAAILAPEYPNSTIITDSVTSDRLTRFLEKDLGLKHHCFKRGYKNVINECKRLNKEGIVSPLAMETSGHGALKDNFYLDDGAFLAVKIVIALANAKAQGKTLASLIEKLDPLVEAQELRYKINCEDFGSYGDKVLEEFKARAEKAGMIMPKSYEGVRISFQSEDKKGWLLLRKSLHDPVMPLNVEGERVGDAKKILQVAQELLAGFDKLSK